MSRGLGGAFEYLAPRPPSCRVLAAHAVVVGASGQQTLVRELGFHPGEGLLVGKRRGGLLVILEPVVVTALQGERLGTSPALLGIQVRV